LRTANGLALLTPKTEFETAPGFPGSGSRLAESAATRDRGLQILPIDSHETTMSSSSQEDLMIEGLMLTIPREELRRLLEQRVVEHQRRAVWWKREQTRAPRNKRKTSRCSQSTSARTKRSGTNGVPPFWDSFATVSNLPRSIDWVKRISRSASCCQKSPDRSSRRNTKSEHASDSISNDSPEEQANWGPGNWPPRREEARTKRSRHASTDRPAL